MFEVLGRGAVGERELGPIVEMMMMSTASQEASKETSKQAERNTDRTTRKQVNE
jgi:hypothetical protein